LEIFDYIQNLARNCLEGNNFSKGPGERKYTRFCKHLH
jgi:hypothetical protein